MKILVTSDWHVDAVTAGVERLPELARYVSSLEEAIHTEHIDVVLNLGDCWDPGTIHDPRWASFVFESFVQLGRASKNGLIAIPGNHDVIDFAHPMSTLSALRVVQHEAATVLEVPTLHRVGDVAFLALPYVSRAFERSAGYQRAYDKAIEAAMIASQSSSLIVLGHLSFDGMHPGSETTDMARGREVPFPVADIEQVGASAVLNGHYHAHQTIRRGALDIVIPGAPSRFTFGEVKDGPRGFVVVEV